MNSLRTMCSFLTVGVLSACSNPDLVADRESQVGLVAEALAESDLGAVKSQAELERMAKHVSGLYADTDVLHRFKTSAGDTVDCIDEGRQFPLRQSKTKIAPRPNFAPPAMAAQEQVARMLEDGVDADGNERRCPPGTVAERRIDMSVLKQYRDLDQLLGRGAKVGQSSAPTFPAQAAHEYATVLHRVAGKYGITAHIQLWTPPEIEGNTGGFGSAGDLSIMQIWAGANPGQSTHESVEAGFVRYKSFTKSALFVYFDPDNYGNGGPTAGCWNSLCANSFVKYSGAAYTPGLTFADNQYSVYGGQQRGLQITLYKNGTGGHWYLGIEGQWIGYWEKSRFDSSGIGNTASALDWGGEISDSIAGRHTASDMGSGQYADQGWTHAAGLWNMAIYDSTSSLNTSPTVSGVNQVANCYTLLDNGSNSSGRSYYLGGPGRWNFFGTWICP